MSIKYYYTFLCKALLHAKGDTYKPKALRSSHKHWQSAIKKKLTKRICFFKDWLIDWLIDLERGEGREKERERNIYRLLLVCALTRTEPATQASALTRNQTGNLSFCRTTSYQLSHTSQSYMLFKVKIIKDPVANTLKLWFFSRRRSDRKVSQHLLRASPSGCLWKEWTA